MRLTKGTTSVLAGFILSSSLTAFGQDVFDLQDSFETLDIFEEFEDVDDDGQISNEAAVERNQELIGRTFTQSFQADLLDKEAKDLTDDEGQAVQLLGGQTGPGVSIQSFMFGGSALDQALSNVQQLKREGQLADAIVAFKPEETDDTSRQKGFWTSKSASIRLRGSYASNPTKKDDGDNDTAGDVQLSGKLEKEFTTKDGKTTGDVLSVDYKLAATNYTDNIGSDGAFTSLEVSHAKQIDGCWKISASAGARSEYFGTFDHWGASVFPLTVAATRNILRSGQKCGNVKAKTNTSVRLGLTRTLANPSTRQANNAKLALTHKFSAGEWKLSAKPEYSVTDYTDLDGGTSRTDHDVSLTFSAGTPFGDNTEFAISVTVGDRSSNGELRDTDFVSAPVAFSLKHTFGDKKKK